MEYKDIALDELSAWQQQMEQRSGGLARLSKMVQNRINRLIPEKVHLTITRVIKEMVRGVLFGAKATTGKPDPFSSLELMEKDVQNLIRIFRTTAAAEGGVAGAGGFLLALADFPALLAIKVKMLFDIAAKYGYDTNDYKERIFILYVFQLAFCSPQKRTETYRHIVDWPQIKEQLPQDIHSFDWRSFQQEYRDYLDLAKMAQLIPVIGAAVGLVVNYRLVNKLGNTAMQCYRLRLVQDGLL